MTSNLLGIKLSFLLLLFNVYIWTHTFSTIQVEHFTQSSSCQAYVICFAIRQNLFLRLTVFIVWGYPDTQHKNFRLEDAQSDLRSLTEVANELRRTGQMYKLRFERRCADLQMAEAEVTNLDLAYAVFWILFLNFLNNMDILNL